MNQQQGWGPGAYSYQQSSSSSWSQNQPQSLSTFNSNSNSNESNGYGANNHNSHNSYNNMPSKFQQYSHVNKAPPYPQVNFLPGGYNNQQGGYSHQNQGNWNANKPWGVNAGGYGRGRGGWNAGWRRNKIKRAPKEKKFYECDLCKVRCDTPDQLNIHKSSKKHNKRVKAAEAAKNAPPPNPAKKKKPGKQKRQKFHCELCGVWCDTDTILQVHLKSKKHQKKEKQPPIANGQFRCTLCNVSCSSQHALESHMSSKRHIRNVFQHEAAKNPDICEECPPKETETPKPKPAAAPEGEESKEEEKSTEAKDDTGVKAEGTGDESKCRFKNRGASGAEEKVRCELCRMVCQNQEAYDFHISTNRHKKHVAAMNMEFKCPICCIGTNTKLMLDKHLESKNHKEMLAKLDRRKWGYQKSPSKIGAPGKRKRKRNNRKKKKKLSGLEGTVPDDAEEGVDNSNQNPEDCPRENLLPFVCLICDVRCNTQEVLNIHLASKRHFRKVKFANDQKAALFCDPCEFQASSKGDFDEHLRSKTHADAAGLSFEDGINGKRKGDFDDEPRKKAKIEEEEWKVCRLCGSEAHKFENCPIKEDRGWQIDKIERAQLKKCTTIANDRHRDLVVLFTVKDKNEKRLSSHFICCAVDVQRKMLHQALKLMSDMLRFVPHTTWYEIDYRFGNWLHKPKKSAPHLHILFAENHLLEFLSAQPAHSPIWPQGISNYEEFSLTQPVKKNYDFDLVYATKKLPWYNNFIIVDNLLLETKKGLEILLKNGVCDGSVGLRVQRNPDDPGKQIYQFFIRVSAEPFISMNEVTKSDIEKELEEASFSTYTGKQWKETARI